MKEKEKDINEIIGRQIESFKERRKTNEIVTMYY